jgi:hypothetical protein
MVIEGACGGDGRHDEREVLVDCSRQCGVGTPVLVVCGEPGVGKTALAFVARRYSHLVPRRR